MIDYFRQLGVTARFPEHIVNTANEKGLYIKLRQAHLRLIEKKAAVKIQCWFRYLRIKLIYKNYKAVRVNSVTKIQRNYR
jgi:hypothetical protein